MHEQEPEEIVYVEAMDDDTKRYLDEGDEEIESEDSIDEDALMADAAAEEDDAQDFIDDVGQGGAIDDEEDPMARC